MNKIFMIIGWVLTVVLWFVSPKVDSLELYSITLVAIIVMFSVTFISLTDEDVDKEIKNSFK